MPERLPNLPFHLHTSPNADPGFVVAEIEAVEVLSEPYAWDLVCVWDGAVSFADLPQVGQGAVLTIDDSESADSPPRQVRGILEDVAYIGTAYHKTGSWFSVRLVPRLWKATQTRRRRIFQSQTVQQIVDQVLTAHGAVTRWQVLAPPPPLAFCVQYDESDFEFVQRLLGRFGFYYYFDPGTGDASDVETAETVVICQRTQDYAALTRAGVSPLVLRLAEREGTMRTFEAISRFQAKQRAAPTVARQRDWDMRTPQVIGDFATPPATDHPALGSDTLTIDEFEQRNANDTVRFTGTWTRTMLEQQRAKWGEGSGASDCILLSPGYRFCVENHELSVLNTAWVATRVMHKGRVPEWARERRENNKDLPAAYINTFECAPATLAVRVPLRPREPVRGTESAVVVGPEGEEIFTDEFGRIKIQFLWDRDGQNDDHSSIWVRVMQPWAGQGWGFQFIPRIGMEVVVSFQGGDPDHPLVIGCVNNAMLVPSHTLPGEKTKSGIRTNSSPGGAGSNEITFEDAAGQEMFYLHAQKDRSENVGNDASLAVGRNESRSVGNDRTDAVGNNENRTVGGQRTRRVGGDDALTVSGDRFETVRGNQTVAVSQDQTVRVEGNRLDVVTGRIEAHGASDRTTRIDGHDRYETAKSTEEVAGEHLLAVKGSSTIKVGTSDAKRTFVLHVEGLTSLSTTGDAEVLASDSISLICGTSSILITPSAIQITSDTITLAGSTACNIKADAITQAGKNCSIVLKEKKVQVLADTSIIAKSDTIKLKSSGGGLQLDGDAKLDGGSIKIKSSVDADTDSDSATSTSTTPTTIVLNDADGNPIPNVRYVLVKGDGTEVAGVLDSQGQTVHVLTDSYQVFFPDLPTAEAQ